MVSITAKLRLINKYIIHLLIMSDDDLESMYTGWETYDSTFEVQDDLAAAEASLSEDEHNPVTHRLISDDELDSPTDEEVQATLGALS